MSYTEGHNKSDVKTKKDSCGTVRHFHNKYCRFSNPFVYLRVQLVEKVYCIYNDCNSEDILWDRKILTVIVTYKCINSINGIDSISDLCSAKRKDCRKH